MVATAGGAGLEVGIGGGGGVAALHPAVKPATRPEKPRRAGRTGPAYPRTGRRRVSEGVLRSAARFVASFGLLGLPGHESLATSVEHLLRPFGRREPRGPGPGQWPG